MRTLVVLLFLLLAGTCYADDPLETLNTVEDTLQTMEHTLQAQVSEDDGGGSTATAGATDDAPQQSSGN